MTPFSERKDVRLVVMCGLVVVSHTAVTYFEEQLFKRQGFSEGFFMMFVMCAQYSILHTLARPWIKEKPLPELLREAHSRKLIGSLVALCVTYAGSNAVSKACLGFVSVPTQIVFKSCKLVAVMVGSKFILGKAYAWFEYFIASLLVLGMISFAGADIHSNLGGQETNMRTLIGCLLLCLALCCDSVLGNLQEKVQKGGLCDELSLMYIQSLFGAFFLLLWTILNGEFQSGTSKALASPRVMWCLNAWSLFNMFGIIIMLKVAGEFSAVTAVLTSSVRKFTSLIVSYAFFPKPLSFFHAIGLCFVFGAIALHQHWKQSKKKQAPKEADMGAMSLSSSSPYDKEAQGMEEGVLLQKKRDAKHEGAKRAHSFKEEENGQQEEAKKLLSEEEKMDGTSHEHGR